MNIDDKKEKLIPELRFNEFKGEWEIAKLGNIASFSKGKNLSKADIDPNGKYPCIRYGELYTHYKEYAKDIVSRTNLDKNQLTFSKVNDVIIPASGETAIDISTAVYIDRDDIALGGDLNIIRSSLYGYFLALSLSNKKKKAIARLAQGISVIHLYPEHLKTVPITYPSIPEQQKISSFLSLIDKKIELLNKKKELLEIYKKGIMQKIFNRDIRFKDSNDNYYPEWEEKRLGEIGKTYNGLSGKSGNDFGEGENFITYKQIFDNSQINPNRFGKVKIESEEKQNLVKYGDIFFTTSSETPNEVGFSSVLLDEVKNTYLNSFCFGFRPNSFEILFPMYTRFFFRSRYIRKIMYKLAQGSTRFNMSKDELTKEKILLPQTEEQKRIAKFLQNTNQFLEYQNILIEKMKIFKQGLLQKMFI